MKNLYNSFWKIMNLLRNRIYFFLFLISISSILFINLSYVLIERIELIETNIFLSLLFKLLTAFSSIFTILFLPTYPIFFILIKNKVLNFRERLMVTIVSNLSFYIIIGYIGSYLALPITFEYFFFSLMLAYLSILLIVIFHGYYRGTGSLLKKVKSLDFKQINNKKFSLSNPGIFCH